MIRATLPMFVSNEHVTGILIAIDTGESPQVAYVQTGAPHQGIAPAKQMPLAHLDFHIMRCLGEDRNVLRQKRRGGDEYT